MIVFFPIGHEEGQTRKRPLVTIALILICAVVFALTDRPMRKQQDELEAMQAQMSDFQVKAFTKIHAKKGGDLIAAMVDPEASNYNELIQGMGRRANEFWQDFTAGRLTEKDDPLFLEYKELLAEQKRVEERSIVLKYGMAPSRVTLLTLITCMFLHANLGHLLVNMFFLYLYGLALEDVWGKWLYLVFYLLAGFAASAAHIMMNLGSDVPSIGASGAIAGLMGAFLIRFYKRKIHYAYYYVLLRIHYGTFSLPAIAALPFWLGAQLLYASLMAQDATSVAYWAHIGGFGFGVAGAFAISLAGFGSPSVLEEGQERLEQLKKTPPVDIQRGIALYDQGRTAEAIEYFDRLILENTENYPARHQRAMIMAESGQTKAIVAEFRTLITKYDRERNFPLVAELLEAIGDKIPNCELDSGILYRLAGYYKQNWNNENAVTMYMCAAAARGPNMGAALLDAARLTSTRLKDNEAAKLLYQRIIDELPGQPEHEIARRELDKLK